MYIFLKPLLFTKAIVYSYEQKNLNSSKHVTNTRRINICDFLDILFSRSVHAVYISETEMYY